MGYKPVSALLKFRQWSFNDNLGELISRQKLPDQMIIATIPQSCEPFSFTIV
jgi:hypothetical protein